jgi:hypothetical protein
MYQARQRHHGVALRVEGGVVRCLISNLRLHADRNTRRRALPFTAARA